MISMDYGLLSELNDLQDSKVYEYLSDRLEEIKVQLIHCQEESTYRTLQGRALMLSDILISITQARDKMVDLRKNKPSMYQAF